MEASYYGDSYTAIVATVPPDERTAPAKNETCQNREVNLHHLHLRSKWLKNNVLPLSK